MPSDASSAILTATDLEVRYNEQVVLNQASLSIFENDHIGMVGRNGSGKSTFLRILTGEQESDSGTVVRRRDLVVGYLSQNFMLNRGKNVFENIRAGAQHVLDLIHEFESLPAESKRHADLEERIITLDGWGLDQRIKTAMSHLNVPAGDRLVDTLSGGETRRVAMCRAIISRPDLLILDEPTNHLDPEAIEWVTEFLSEFRGAYLVVTHDRYFLDQVATRLVELSDGRFFSHDGNYTDYLFAKAERQAADATVEHKRQMFLKKELAWVRTGPRAQRTKQKNRFERYYETAAQDGTAAEEGVELIIPPAPPLGNRVIDLSNTELTLSGRTLFSNFSFSFDNGMRIGVAGRNGLGKTSLLRMIIGQLKPSDGTVKAGQLTKFNYVDQARLQLNEEHTVLREVSDGTEFVIFGNGKLSLRAYLKRFLFTDDRINTQVKHLSGGERSRLLLARILKQGGNFLILDEPTNDLDLATLRVLEEALIAFDGCVLVVSHDRYFLNRVCTGILAFEGDEQIKYSVGDYDYYLEKKSQRESLAAEAPRRAAAPESKPIALPPSRPRKLNFKETRELAGIEAQITAEEEEIARIEALFTTPDFHQQYGQQTKELLEKIAAAKEKVAQMYARWEELEAIGKSNPA